MPERFRRRLAAGTVAVVVALVGSGSAFACDGHRGSDRVLGAQHALRLAGGHQRGLLALPAAYLGLTTGQIAAQLQAGKTLAQIADGTPGHSAAGLVDYLVAAVKAKLDRAVAAGKLTQAQETSLLATVRTKLTALVNGTFRHDGRDRHHR
jgi:hypothetical protein